MTNKPKKLPPPDDTIFFHKGQIKVGTHLVYKGRLDPDSVWRVVSIYSFMKDVRARMGLRRLDGKVTYLSDIVLLSRIGAPPGRGIGVARHCSFAHLSYSAIWRLRDTRR